MKKCILIVAMCLGSVLLLSGCGPIYEDHYSYIPPRTSEGMMCIANCETSRSHCTEMLAMQKQDCEYRTDRDYHACLRHERDSRHCYQAYCDTDDSNCKNQFNSCYQSCGGTINNDRVCVAFCNG